MKSASSSGHASPSSRAIALLSEKMTEPTLILHIYVHIGSANPEFLSAVFDKHVDYEEHVLGIVMDDDDNTTIFDDNWHAQELMGVGYRVSSSLHTSYTTSYTTAPSLHSLFENIPQSPTPISPARFSQAAQQLITLAALRSILTLPLNDGKSTLHVVERPGFVFNPLSRTTGFQTFIPFFTTIEHEQETLAGNIPTLEEWDKLWAAWDMVTLQMIPQEMLHQKPIDLRHKCLFYIGHIPT